MLAKWNSRVFLMTILSLQLLVYVTIIFNVPFARQVVGFFYLTFVPGIVIVRLLRLDKLDGLETLLFSMGLSIAFLMLTGLLINEFGLLLGILEPLSLIPLTLVLNGLILVGGIATHLRRRSTQFLKTERFRLRTSAMCLMVLPILSVVGAIWVNAFEKNIILLFMIAAIALLFIIAVISKRLLPPKLYPLALVMIAISLLYHSSLVSNYLTSFGSDVPIEYSVFETTKNNAQWSSVTEQSLLYGKANSMLSITILPVIYSNLMNMDTTWLFKIVYPLIFSFAVLGWYKIWQKYVGRKYAFIATFFFIAQQAFYTEMFGLNRQMIAELFFVLLLLVILNEKMKPLNKFGFFVVFSVGLVLSHYALSIIFLLFISLVWISSTAMKRLSKKITLAMVVFLLVAMFSWDIYTSNAAVFVDMLMSGNYVLIKLGDFFDLGSRGTMVLRGLGMEAPPSFWNMIGRAFAYLTQFFVVVGFVGLITKRTKAHLDREYLTLTSIAMAFLFALIIVPGLAETLQMTRFYHILLFFLAPLCVLGAETLVKLAFKHGTGFKVSILLLIVLVPYFLFQTSFAYEVTGSESWSISLSKYRMDGLLLYSSLGYIDERDVFGARWLKKNVYLEHTQVYSDAPSYRNVLTSYGMIPREDITILSNTTMVAGNGTIYLRRFNIIEGVIVGVHLRWNTTELSFLDDMSKIYSNGGSELYKNTEIMEVT